MRLPVCRSITLSILAAFAWNLAKSKVESSTNQPAAGPIPAGFNLVLEQHFDTPEALKQFAFSDPKAWKHSADGTSFALELAKQSDYQPTVRSPFNIALIGDRVFGDFILEVDLLQTGKEYGHRDMCLFFGVQDPTHFYYAHVATKTDDHAHNIFIVNGEPRAKISQSTTPGVQWGLNQWHRLRMERVGPAVRVYFDDMLKPVMTSVNGTLGEGWIGFGSFDDTGKVDNIRVWAPMEPSRRRCEFFRNVP